MRLGSTGATAIGPAIRRRPVHRDAPRLGQVQFVLERPVWDQLTGLGQSGHAHPMVPILVKARQCERRQLHKIVRDRDPARLVIECDKMRPAWVSKFACESRLRVPATLGQSAAPLLRAVIFVMVPLASVTTGGASHLTRVPALSSFCMSRTMTRRECSSS